MWDFSLSGALAAMRKAAPFIVFRMLVYFGIALLYILATALGSGLGFWAFIISFLVAWSFKSALLEPLAMYALMQVYFKHIEGQEPNPEWEQRLSAASGKFQASSGN